MNNFGILYSIVIMSMIAIVFLIPGRTRSTWRMENKVRSVSWNG